MSKKPIVIITGPTAAGKTDLSIMLAKAINGEIISADSMQVYKEMNIGTAKIMPEEMQGVKHHMIDIFEPEHSFNVAEFKELSKKSVDSIIDAGKIPIVAGGTGFYIQALLYDIDFKEEVDDGYRATLNDIAETEGGIDKLHEMLNAIDPESAVAIHKNNVKRVIRALEYYHYNNAPISKHNEIERQKESEYNFIYFVLTMDRDKLYARIDKRVDIMVSNGLFEEVEALINKGLTRDHISMQGIGYKELFDYFEGSKSKDEVIDAIKQDTRHFAKRQLTWFRREKSVTWVDKDMFNDDNEILEHMIKLLSERGII